MVKGTVRVTSGVDRMADIRKQIAALAKKEVLVGIPEEEATREGSGEINNAELLYIQSHGIRKTKMRHEMKKNIDSGMKYSVAHSLYVQEHGSPLWQVPPRPVLEPAIEHNKNEIAKGLKQISQAALDGDPTSVQSKMDDVGLDTVGYIQDWFENPQNGWPPNTKKTIQIKGSDQPLVDTGEMSKKITYVVRDKS